MEENKHTFAHKHTYCTVLNTVQEYNKEHFSLLMHKKQDQGFKHLVQMLSAHAMAIYQVLFEP